MEKLYNKKEDCCVCGACVNICPKNAITMKKDKYGFLFPSVDSEKCIDCQMCRKVCAYQNISETNKPLKTWVAVSENKKSLEKSASGGVFYTIANQIVKNGGCAVGAAFDSSFNLNHIIADNSEKLKKLQGSKYTQSSTGLIFRDIKKKLLNGEKVLFSGCPCQVAGLKAYLGKNYDNLVTVDLICHGVPSNAVFKDYISSLEKRKKISVRNFSFRDKSIGWGKNGSAISENGKKYKLFETSESYFYYFAKSLIMRKNCYTCKYACGNRTGDITIGDFWGIQKEHPEILGKNGINESKGVSVIIASTQKGIDIVEENKKLFQIYESSFEKASRGNQQLKRPSKYNPKREEILQLYAESGWEAVEARFNKNIGMKKYTGYIKSLIPNGVKRQLKKILK